MTGVDGGRRRRVPRAACSPRSAGAWETASRWPSRGVYESVASRPRSVFTASAAPTLRSHGNADPCRRAGSRRLRRSTGAAGSGLAVGSTSGAARSSAHPHRRSRARRAERPGCLVAHPPRRLDHRPPSDPRRRTVRVHGFRQSAGRARMAVRDHLRRPRRSRRTVAGDRADGAGRMERDARDGAARPHARRRAGGSRRRARARSACGRTGPRHPPPGLHVRADLLDALDRRVVPALRRQASLVAAPAVPSLGEPACRVHRGHRLPCDRRRRRGDQASLGARRRSLPCGASGLGVAVGASVLAACVNPYGPSLFVFAATTGATERQKGIIEWQSPNFADPAMWVLLALLLTFAALTITVLARPVIAASLRPSRLRACGGRGGARAHVGSQHRDLRRGDGPAVDGDDRRRGGVAPRAAPVERVVSRDRGSRRPSWASRSSRSASSVWGRSAPASHRVHQSQGIAAAYPSCATGCSHAARRRSACSPPMGPGATSSTGSGRTRRCTNTGNRSRSARQSSTTTCASPRVRSPHRRRCTC